MRRSATIYHYPDRVSVSFCEDADEVDTIVTVTFDRRRVADLGQDEIVALAESHLCAEWRR